MAAWISSRNGSIVVRWKFQGRFGSRKVPDRKTAKTLVREIETQHALGHEYRPRDREVKGWPSLGEIMAAHIDALTRTRTKKTIDNKRTAFIAYIKYLRKRKPRGRLTSDLVNEQSIERFYDDTINRGLTATTARHYATAIKVFWQWASMNREFEQCFDRYRRPDLPAPRESKVARSLTWGQLDELIKQESPGGERPQCVKLMVLQRYTGLRVKQAGGLLWEDIDLEGCRLRVRPELGKSALEKRGRIIPVTRHLIDEVAGWGLREGLILHPGHRDKDLHVESIRKAVVRAWRRSSVDPSLYERQTSHVFRKAFTSELVRRGADRWAVEVMLGRSTGLGGDVYTDPAFVWESMAEAAQLVSKIGDDVAVNIRKTITW